MATPYEVSAVKRTEAQVGGVMGADGGVSV